MDIAIHALREEGDKRAQLDAGEITISIHALREEGDWVPVVTVVEPHLFLSTPSARRATSLLGGA